MAGPRIIRPGAVITVTASATSVNCPNAEGLLGAQRIGSSGSMMPMVGRVRLRAAAHERVQIKLRPAAAAAVRSVHDVSTFTEAELRTAVEAAERGTYVALMHTRRLRSAAIAASVGCIGAARHWTTPRPRGRDLVEHALPLTGGSALGPAERIIRWLRAPIRSTLGKERDKAHSAQTYFSEALAEHNERHVGLYPLVPSRR